VQAGDIVLVSRGNGILDKLVQWATVSPFYHAAIALNESEIIEAAFRGARYNSLATYAGRCSVLTVAGATPEQGIAAANYAQGYIGSAYGWKDIIEDALVLGLHVPGGYRWRSWHHYDCSCLVAAAWADGGTQLTLAPAPSPADLGWSPVLVGPRPWAHKP